MNTTQQKLDAISREPFRASYRMLHKLRAVYENYRARDQASVLPLKTKALLVVFAGVGAITILEFVKTDDKDALLAPPPIALTRVPAESPQELAESTILTESLRRYGELNQVMVGTVAKPAIGSQHRQ